MLSEDDVSKAVAAFLKSRGFTAVEWLPAGRSGFDISTAGSATHKGWLIESKGAVNSKGDVAGKPFPSGSVYTNVAQAFARAAYWRDHELNNGRSTGFAIPSTDLYDLHSRRLERACGELGITIFRVDERHQVTATPGL